MTLLVSLLFKLKGERLGLTKSNTIEELSISELSTLLSSLKIVKLERFTFYHSLLQIVLILIGLYIPLKRVDIIELLINRLLNY